MRFRVRLSMGANVLGFNGIVYLVVGDVPVDFFFIIFNEAPVVTSNLEDKIVHVCSWGCHCACVISI